jgi:hypothetical protein
VDLLVEGTGQGHGGLCQSGTKVMAADGSDFRRILSHQYPNTDIVSIHTVADSLATLDRRPVSVAVTHRSQSQPVFATSSVCDRTSFA